MPFTPLHMGPGLVIKACLQSTFSLMVFGWAQILIDIQPLVVLLTGKGALHGLSHTYFGATAVAVIAALSGKYLGELGLRILRMPQFNPIRWGVAFGSAFIGTWSHVLIDNIMHADLMPFAPFSEHRGIYAVIGADTLHVVCLASAAVGGAAFALIESRRRR